jgi:O-acetyl-ADP-ribose deacetylase (regulator of RNase III)
MISNFDGDIFTYKTANYICHQVNCKGVMGSGIAKQVKEQFPKVYYEYRNLCTNNEIYDYFGTCQIVKIDEDRSIVNLFGQNDFTKDKLDTDYEQLNSALLDLYDKMDKSTKVVVAFPYKMSCDRAKGDWNIVYNMILTIFNKPNIDIEIWKYNNE